MFKDFKSTGFNLENTQSNNIHYAKMLYFCVFIAYTYIISLSISCGNDKKTNYQVRLKILMGIRLKFIVYLLLT